MSVFTCTTRDSNWPFSATHYLLLSVDNYPARLKKNYFFILSRTLTSIHEGTIAKGKHLKQDKPNWLQGNWAESWRTSIISGDLVHMGGLMHWFELSAPWTMPFPDKRNLSSVHAVITTLSGNHNSIWLCMHRSSLPGLSFSWSSPSMHPRLTQLWAQAWVHTQGILITRLARRFQVLPRPRYRQL